MLPRITDRIVVGMVHQTRFAEGTGFSETAIQLTSVLGRVKLGFRIRKVFDHGGSGNQRGRDPVPDSDRRRVCP